MWKAEIWNLVYALALSVYFPSEGSFSQVQLTDRDDDSLHGCKLLDYALL